MDDRVAIGTRVKGGPEVRAALRGAAVRAARAASILNTQPWRLVLHADALDVVADRTRLLPVLDPQGRHLAMSLGCALFNARVGLDAVGVDAEYALLPFPAHPDLAARVGVRGPAPDGSAAELAALDPAIDLRRTARRGFTDGAVPAAVLTAVQAAARAEGAELVPVTREDERLALLDLLQEADRILRTDPRRRRERVAWTTADARRCDGVTAVPDLPGVPAASSAPAITAQPADERSTAVVPPALFVLTTATDDLGAWLRAGQALERVWLEAAAAGLAALPLSQVVEMPSLRRLLTAELGLSGVPQLVLSLGAAAPVPRSRRRRLVEVIAEATDR